MPFYSLAALAQAYGGTGLVTERRVHGLVGAVLMLQSTGQMDSPAGVEAAQALYHILLVSHELDRAGVAVVDLDSKTRDV